jgi:hypothetical protein
MKKFFCIMALLCVFCFLTAAASNAQSAVDPRKVGVTTKGVAYIADDWVKQTGGSSPAFVSGLTGWSNKKEMKLNASGYWEVATGRAVSSAIIFCFELDYSDKWIPHVLVDLGILAPARPGTLNAAVDNSRGGYNFYMTPVPKAPWEK